MNEFAASEGDVRWFLNYPPRLEKPSSECYTFPWIFHSSHQDDFKIKSIPMKSLRPLQKALELDYLLFAMAQSRTVKHDGDNT